MKKNLVEKLKAQAGESLAETLLAVLIIAVAALLLASMISSTANMVKSSEASLEEYYKQGVNLEKLDDASSATNIKITAVTSGTSTSYTLTDKSVNYAANDELGRYSVVAYKLP